MASGSCPRVRVHLLLPALATSLALIGILGCVPAGRRASWRVYPLMRVRPHDGVAVVTRPAGEGIHIWLDPDTSQVGVCRPRWNPDAARLSGGNGDNPTSTGRAPREEFYGAMRRGRVRATLRREIEALCRQEAPRRDFEWVEPPRSSEEFVSPPVPLLEERDLLRDPMEHRRREKQLLGIPLTPEDFEEPPPPPPPGP
jgi:hypothetical protein